MLWDTYLALRALEHEYMDDPLILNFAREYRAVNDIVECSRAHEARISIIAGKVLLKFVEKTKLRQLVWTDLI